MSTHSWQFPARFRRHAYGWRSSRLAVQRLQEALREIKQVWRTDAPLAAEGAVRLLEKLSPALEDVDSSSGALGSAVYGAIETLVPLIAGAEVNAKVRQEWLERLWQALQDDQIPYIESLGEHWGTLCGTPELASVWADELLPGVKSVWSPNTAGYGFLTGTIPCLSALFAAGRHDELLSLLAMAPYKHWHYRQWGVKALAAQGKKAEALRYAEASKGLNDPLGQIAETCEALLLSSGMAEEAYQRYAIAANQRTTHLATFRAIAKKYPSQPKAAILRDLVASTPGAEGQWFAAAKDAGLYDLAIDLVAKSPTDPRTLMRAARDFADKEPSFAVEAGLAALRWIAAGRGYDITGAEILEAYSSVQQAATAAGFDPQELKSRIHGIFSKTPLGLQLPNAILAQLLSV